ncbi:MAG TPA: ectonucleotide pyrophosphatase/phosphodiesterase [Novosphingobium sp.]|nr:ectonucleotide pyrophosphatase/phosphodiesterase [Novosphingobium sp.]
MPQPALPAPAQLTAPANPPAQASKAPVTILVSIDGFRPDYLERGITPTLNALATQGISAAMRPSFPSKTFPNHWALVTGLRPDRNGIVSNKMTDPRRPGEVFTMETTDPFWWDAAEPLWISAEKAGIRTATMFWPGSNVAIGGRRASDWWPYAKAVTNSQRVAGMIDWLRRPAATRPAFLTLYFDVVDTQGHDFGPDSPEVNAAIAQVDSAIGALRDGLAQLRQPANLVIVADHGMAAIDAHRVIRLDAVLPQNGFTALEDGPFVMLTPTPGNEVAVATALAHPPAHVHCWAKGRLPARLHYGANPRVPAWVCLADSGWVVLKDEPAKPVKGGTHGYDNDAPDMRALFIASGPAIRAAGRLPTFDNVDVAPLLRDLIGLPQALEGDGSDAPFRTALRR